MTRYSIERLWGLRDLLSKNDDLYSPGGNRLTVVRNGLLGGELLYDHKSKKVYGLCLKEIKDPGDEYLEQCAGQYAQEQVKWNMNYKDAIDFLKEKGKWEE